MDSRKAKERIWRATLRRRLILGSRSGEPRVCRGKATTERRPPCLGHHHGFSLIELLVVIAIIQPVGGLAVAGVESGAKSGQVRAVHEQPAPTGPGDGAVLKRQRGGHGAVRLGIGFCYLAVAPETLSRETVRPHVRSARASLGLPQQSFGHCQPS
ncbi:MAG: prepilin-type N-terminal cleavage/methylation domain-containing protein [Verrucomicrobia bacterium]|nr:prepilin-type N-terminal cleavage/methylation domain-containing protein [Verrucomicrobiota bacterium]